MKIIDTNTWPFTNETPLFVSSFFWTKFNQLIKSITNDSTSQ